MAESKEEEHRTGKDSASLHAAFAQAVHKHHVELLSRGMNPNEACALALRAAAGQVSMPKSLSDIYASLQEAEETKSYSSVCSMMRMFFSNADALHASFWPRQNQQPANKQAEQPQQQQQQQAQQQEQLQLHHSSTYESQQQRRQQKQPEQPGAGSHNCYRKEDIGSSSSNNNNNNNNNNQHNCYSSKYGNSSSGGLPDDQLQQRQPPWLHIDPAAVQELHDQLEQCRAEVARDALMQGAQQLLLHISDCVRQQKDNPGFCRQVCALLANPWLQHMECQHLLAAVAGVLVEVSQSTAAPAAAAADVACAVSYAQQLKQLMLSWQAPEMGRVVGLLQQYITLTLYQQQSITRGIQAVTELLSLIEDAASSSGVLDMAQFYNDAVNEPDFNIKEDYKRWNKGCPSRHGFSFCAHPWIYDPASKSRILQLDNQMQQLAAFENSVMRALMSGTSESCPFLLLRVRRGRYLLRDTLVQINHAKNDGSLKKPLKVKFIGEEGVDEGGLQKEFFQLLVRECFNPDFGMFAYSDETHLHWFRASSMDLDTEYELIGILIGLAIYNSHILEFQFPLVLYKKLMGKTVGLEDLAELHPEMHSSLRKLLVMGQEELAGMELTFQIETEVGCGERVCVELISGGADAAVTTVNVQQYVDAYAQHYLVNSIARQFDAFQRGFLRLCSGKALQFFRPAELEQLVCGGRVVDLSALEAATHYEDGYTECSAPVRWFWEVVHAFDDAHQKRLLFFITGSDRVPIKGLGHLSPPFVISRNGNDNSRLPTAHTCFNHLLLPAYENKETLQARLLLAVEHAEGFGML